MRYSYTPIKMTNIIPRAWKDAKLLEVSYTAGENTNDITVLENSLDVSYKVKHQLIT